MTNWNSDQYLKFQNERTQPAVDLVNRISLIRPMKIIDIGCGPGNSTRVLADKFKEAYILGIDNSKNMIDKAMMQYPELAFKLYDIQNGVSTLDNDYDIVFSNACIQWVPHHTQLIKNLFSLLREGGALAIQIPINYCEPIHEIIHSISTSQKWKTFFNIPRVFHILTQNEYFDILSDLTQSFFIWETAYYHIMKSHHAILEWYRGTGLRPYLEALPQDRIKEYEDDITKQIIERYPVQKNGKVIFRFPRLFLLAYKQ